MYCSRSLNFFSHVDGDLDSDSFYVVKYININQNIPTLAQ